MQGFGVCFNFLSFLANTYILLLAALLFFFSLSWSVLFFFPFPASSFPASTNYPRRTSDPSGDTALSCSSPFWCSFPPCGTATPTFLTPSVPCLSYLLGASRLCSSAGFLTPSRHNGSWPCPASAHLGFTCCSSCRPRGTRCAS